MTTAILLMTTLLIAGDKNDKLVISDPTTGNDRIDITATLILEKEALAQAMEGIALPPNVIAVRVKVKPAVNAGPIRVDIDDFQLISHKDGQRSGPFAPTQLAGGPAMKIKTESTSYGTGVATRNTGPTWGGMGGSRPGQQMPGNTGMIGSANAGGAEIATGVEKTGKASKETDPLVAMLKEKGFPSGEVAEPTTGLLYFPLEGKHKPKDLTLVYKGPAGRLVLTFGK
ncbi:hypothetical protein F183_A31410 [Bryobacterales bacterium F-183]|nr:hypothetical protein F183_A31410 [Bryobacterales bacterium F-183]